MFWVDIRELSTDSAAVCLVSMVSVKAGILAHGVETNGSGEPVDGTES